MPSLAFVLGLLSNMVATNQQGTYIKRVHQGLTITLMSVSLPSCGQGSCRGAYTANRYRNMHAQLNAWP